MIRKGKHILDNTEKDVLTKGDFSADGSGDWVSSLMMMMM